ncbi:MAG TPA: non-heme iron oxygenase ferredoxin subunit [Pyrinomonadaceae bacterium]|jgi:nitrite reductase/ring-hydroxylating ferredoxin subunit
MQSIDTNDTNSEPSPEARKVFDAGRIEDLPDGTCKTIELSTGRELALFRVNGEFHATENFCPHKGAALSDGILCGHVIECELHGWQFDVRTGECLTVAEKIQTYEVVVEDGLVKVLL